MVTRRTGFTHRTVALIADIDEDGTCRGRGGEQLVTIPTGWIGIDRLVLDQRLHGTEPRLFTDSSPILDLLAPFQ